MNNIVTAWVDFSHFKVSQGIRFISLFDDTYDVWSGEDLALVSELSETVLWSNSDDLLQKIA